MKAAQAPSCFRSKPNHLHQLWAGVIQEATHAFSRLTRGDDHLKQKITPASIFRSRSLRLFKKDEFADLAESLKNSGASLWSEFSPHLLTFKERWECLVTRDMDYESLLHSKGNQEAVIPWVSLHPVDLCTFSHQIH